MRVLHNAQNEATFDEGVKCFIDKWEDLEKGVVQTLQRSFFNQFKNWFIGVHPRVPKHNNGLERCNASIKLFQTDHKVKPLKQFIHVALAIAKQRSVSIVVDNIAFQTDVIITASMWQRGLSYAKNYVHRPMLDSNNIEFFVFRTGIDKPITLADVDAFEQANYNSFDEFSMRAFDIHKITFPGDASNWQKAVCTCQSFNDCYMCKHVIGIAHQLKAIAASQIPTAAEPNYDNQPLFAARRGRPSKATAALEVE